MTDDTLEDDLTTDLRQEHAVNVRQHASLRNGHLKWLAWSHTTHHYPHTHPPHPSVVTTPPFPSHRSLEERGRMGGHIREEGGAEPLIVPIAGSMHTHTQLGGFEIQVGLIGRDVGEMGRRGR